MLHPSYADLMNSNKDVEEGETKVVNSRYSIVMATAKRAREIIDGSMPLVDTKPGEEAAFYRSRDDRERSLYLLKKRLQNLRNWKQSRQRRMQRKIP